MSQEALEPLRRQIDAGLEVLRGFGAAQWAQAHLVGALWWYSASVLYPARALSRRGVRIVGGPEGEPPTGLPRKGLGPYFSVRHSAPVLLEEPVQNSHLVDEFDRLAWLYESLVRPFSTPIFNEALEVIRGYLSPDSRVLDAGCGPGRELRRIASFVPQGEVVGVDLAAGMVNAAYSSARRRRIQNAAFFQADVGALPRAFSGRFDIVYSSLAHHHFPDPFAAATNVLRCLRRGGVYCVIDPGPAWFNRLSAPLGRLADPGWIGWKTPEEFRTLITGAGFARAAWFPLLPGFGLAVGQKG